MNISQNGINLIKKFEGCVLQVYLDVVGIKTIGYGHTGPDVNALPVGARISQEQADAYLVADLTRFEANVNKYDPIYHWTANEYDALCSFAYNVGSIDKLTNKGTRSKQVIANVMLSYNKAGGKLIPGLAYRRQIERELFLGTVQTVERTYVEGDTYTLIANLYIRTEPNGEKLKHRSITDSARRQSRFDDQGYAILSKGSRVTCKGIRKVGSTTWIQIPSGWICAREDEKVYIQ